LSQIFPEIAAASPKRSELNVDSSLLPSPFSCLLRGSSAFLHQQSSSSNLPALRFPVRNIFGYLEACSTYLRKAGRKENDWLSRSSNSDPSQLCRFPALLIPPSSPATFHTSPLLSLFNTINPLNQMSFEAKALSAVDVPRLSPPLTDSPPSEKVTTAYEDATIDESEARAIDRRLLSKLDRNLIPFLS